MPSGVVFNAVLRNEPNNSFVIKGSYFGRKGLMTWKSVAKSGAVAGLSADVCAAKFTRESGAAEPDHR